MSIRDDEEFMKMLDNFGRRYCSFEYHQNISGYQLAFHETRNKLLDYIDKHIASRMPNN